MNSRRIFWGLAIGAILGLTANFAFHGDDRLNWVVRNLAEPTGKIFINIIFMVVHPLVFAALALGVASFPDFKSLGRIGMKTLLYALIVSSLAVGLGLFVVNLVEPGIGISPETRAQLLSHTGDAPKPPDIPKEGGLAAFLQFLPSLIPTSPLDFLSRNGVLLLMVFGLFFGAAMSRCEREKVAPLFSFLEALLAVSMKIIQFAMQFAPIGVGALLFALAAKFGTELLKTLASFAAVVLFCLAFHQFITYSLILKFCAKTNPIEFFRGIKEVMITAFATSSSNATLPTALRVGEENLKLPPQISRFVLTVGATGNQNGTALYEGVTILFLAQLYLGHHLPIEQQVYVLGMSILAGIGTAGVPSGSIPFIMAICATIGVPPEGVGIILGLDRVLDMCRTVLNVSGDLVAATYIAKSEERLVKPSA